MQTNIRRRPGGPRPVSFAALAALFLVLAACGGRVSGVIPAGLEDEVAAARASLEMNWDNGPVRPTFTFVAARCRADGGLLVVFDQRGFGSDGVAIALQSPGAMPDAWAGGFAPVDPATDPEIVHLFSEAPEVPCHF